MPNLTPGATSPLPLACAAVPGRACPGAVAAQRAGDRRGRGCAAGRLCRLRVMAG
jgi:hypothetical protein